MTALLPEGELAKRAKKHKIDWPELVFHAAAENEAFDDVEIITLQQHCLDSIIPSAVEYCANENIRGDQDTMIAAYISKHNETVLLREFVSTHINPWLQRRYITVGVNRSKIDDDAVDHALTLLEKIKSFESGDYVEFGKSYDFIPSEITI